MRDLRKGVRHMMRWTRGARAVVVTICCLPVAARAGAAAQAVPPAIEAARSGDLEALRGLLEAGGDANESQGDGATALHWAAHRDDLPSAELLLEAGAAVNAANALGATPLWLATINGSGSMVARLLEAGADPNVALRMGETPLMAAVRSGDLPSVRLLLEHGADVDSRERERSQTALMWAASQGHADVVQLLAEYGADLHARSEIRYQLENTAGNTNPSANFRMAHGGSTALLFSARNGDVRTARALVTAGADVNDTAASGTSALVVAAHSGHESLAVYLLEAGADPNAAEAGYTALHAAILRSGVELARALLDRGADPDALVTHGSPGRRFSADYSIRAQVIGVNAFWLAARYGEPEILRMLVERGSDPFVTPASGTTALLAAMGMPGMGLRGATTFENRRDRVAEVPADPSAEERMTLELAEIVLDAGVDIDAVDERGNTALHHAVLRDFPTVVEFLSARGANLGLTNERDQTPMDLAETPQVIPGTNGLLGTRPGVAELLRQLGAQ